MATTIITKNGSGAPVAGDLVQGELAVDLTNKTLYTKDSGGTVIKVGDTGGGSSGTFTDLTATVSLTASGLLYPTTDGTEGQAILTDGNGTLAFGDVVGGIDYTTETSNYTLEANQGVIADTTGGTFVVTLPLAPVEGDQVVVADGGDWSTTNLTVGRNGQTIEGVASDLTMDVGGISVTMVFDGTTWQLYPATGTSASTTYTLDQTTTAGNITTNDITVGGLTAGDTTVGNLTSTGIDDNATATAITIDASQNVGIGTTNPTTPMHIQDGAVSPSWSAYAGTALTLEGATSQGTILQFVATADYTSEIWFGDADSRNSGRIRYENTDNKLELWSNGAERVAIDGSGNLLVGTQTSINSHTIRSTGFVPLNVYRDNGGATNSLAIFHSDHGGTQTEQCMIRGNGDLENKNNSYGGISDERLKSNIVAASSQLDDIMSVQVRSYTLKSTGDTHIGVVAQELEASGMSGLVNTDEDGMKSVKYSILYLKAIKALQEAVTRIETLEAEVAALKGVN